VGTPQKIGKNPNSAINKKRNLGNNLMGSKFERLALMKTRRYSHMGVHYKAGKLSYIYVFGGRSDCDETMSKCEKYSIAESTPPGTQTNGPRSPR
jgi:hypothetical protein